MQCEHHPARRERGAILVTSLLLLVILTVLGVAIMKLSNMQERMAGNTRDVNLALQGAEAALRQAEAEIAPPTVRPVATTNVGCLVCQEGVLPVNLYDNTAFNWVANGRPYNTAIPQLDDRPRYVVEDYMFDRDDPLEGHEAPTGRVFFNITSRSTGASGQANVVLQSTYARRF